MFNVKVTLGNYENMTQSFTNHIPVKQTVNGLLESELWKNSVSHESCETDSDVLGDKSDGQTFKSNQFFIENPGCLKLILYQDAFEVVNALRSFKKKPKVVAVYLSVVILPAHMHSSTDHIPCLVVLREWPEKNWIC